MEIFHCPAGASKGCCREGTSSTWKRRGMGHGPLSCILRMHCLGDRHGPAPSRNVQIGVARLCQTLRAVQLHFHTISKSMSFHESEVMDGRCIGRGNARILDGLLGEERLKTGWMRAEAAGDPGPWRQLAILGRGCWDADALCDIVRDYAIETLADPNAVLVLDETGFQAGQGILRGRSAIYRFSWQDHQMPDRCVRILCLPAWSCLHRQGALSAEGLDG